MNQSQHFKCSYPLVLRCCPGDWNEKLTETQWQWDRSWIYIHWWLHFTLIQCHKAWPQLRSTSKHVIPFIAVHPWTQEKMSQWCLVAPAPIGTPGEPASETRSDMQPWSVAALCAPRRTMPVRPWATSTQRSAVRVIEDMWCVRTRQVATRNYVHQATNACGVQCLYVSRLKEQAGQMALSVCHVIELLSGKGKTAAGRRRFSGELWAGTHAYATADALCT